MKKATILFTLLCIIAALCVSVTACSDEDPQYDAFFSQWQNAIEDETPIKRIAIPGSHDAGSVGMVPIACTQRDAIADQLRGGVRYFDTRVTLSGDKLKIFHGPIKGVDFEPIATALATFMREHPSEFVIVDFQKLSTDAIDPLLRLLDTSGLRDLAVVNATDAAPLTFVDALTLGDVRGKILFTWGEADDRPAPIPDGAQDWLFPRNNDECSLSGSVLDSLYQGDLHRKSSEEFIRSAMPEYHEHYVNKDNGLWVLQCQRTGGADLYLSEKSHNDNMNAYLLDLYDSPELERVNIVMRDYVTDHDLQKVKIILGMNDAKGILSADHASEYRAKIAA